MLTVYKPKPKIDVERYFTAGMKVEVDMEPSRFRNSWYVATIITPPASPPPEFKNPNKRPYFNRLVYKKVTTVEYDNLMDEDGVRRLRETIDAVQMRPIPPMERRGELEFKVGDGIDAFINGGWWEGVIKKVLVESTKIYEVYFRCWKERLEFDEDDLRIRREWVDGDWVPPLLGYNNVKEKREAI